MNTVLLLAVSGSNGESNTAVNRAPMGTFGEPSPGAMITLGRLASSETVKVDIQSSAKTFPAWSCNPF